MHLYLLMELPPFFLFPSNIVIKSLIFNINLSFGINFAIQLISFIGISQVLLGLLLFLNINLLQFFFNKVKSSPKSSLIQAKGLNTIFESFLSLTLRN